MLLASHGHLWSRQPQPRFGFIATAFAFKEGVAKSMVTHWVLAGRVLIV
jgi:hypothetical protein